MSHHIHNRDQLRPFFVTDQSNEMITIQIGDKKQSLQTDNSGEFYEQIELTNDNIQQQRKDDLINYEAIDNDERKSIELYDVLNRNKVFQLLVILVIRLKFLKYWVKYVFLQIPLFILLNQYPVNKKKFPV